MQWLKALAVAAVVGGVAVAGAGVTTRPTSAKAPLAALPSQPGPHIEAIKAMADNSWLGLGRPAPDPKWGPAPGRSYTNKMAFAPDLRGAFLFGEGVHGATGTGPRAGYFNDDLFFYDLNANRWICVNPGSSMTDLTMHLDANGFEAAADGQNVPIAIAVHGYECLTYDTDLSAFMTLETGSPYSKKLMVRRATWLKDKPHGRELGKDPFFYLAKTGRWERRKAEGAGPGTGFCMSLVYLPGKKQTVLYNRGTDLWFYDHATSHWTLVKPQGPPPPSKGHEGTLCHDTKRDRLYVFNRAQTSIPWAYDLKTNTWIDPKATNQPATVEDYTAGARMLSSTSSPVHYDSVNDVVVMRLTVKQGTGDPRNMPTKILGLAIYDPKTSAWQKEVVPLPEKMPRAAWNTFYDPELGVHVYHVAGDSRTNGEVWVYRYRRGPAPAPARPTQPAGEPGAGN